MQPTRAQAAVAVALRNPDLYSEDLRFLASLRAMEGCNPLLASASDSCDSDDESDFDCGRPQTHPEAVLVAAGPQQWVPLRVTDGCAVLIPPIDLDRLQHCGYCRSTAPPRSSKDLYSAVITYWRSNEALLHLQPWRLLSQRTPAPETEPEPEPEETDHKRSVLEWSRALWAQPAHTRSRERGGPGGGVASALEYRSSSEPQAGQIVSAAGQAACHKAAIRDCHEDVQGYASHVQIDCTAHFPPSRPLLILERPAQTGSVCWGCARVFRKWALENSALLFRGRRGADCRVLELGAGVGLLGISLAVDLGVEVVLTDFDGHFFTSLFEDDPNDSVLALLTHNAMANAGLAETRGGKVSVSALDWNTPSIVQSVWPVPSERAPSSNEIEDGAGKLGMPQADVIVGTELIYTAGSASLLCKTLCTWLKPTGVFFLLQAQNRVDMSQFGELANECGLTIEDIDVGGAVKASDEIAAAVPGSFRMIAVTWQDS